MHRGQLTLHIVIFHWVFWAAIFAIGLVHGAGFPSPELLEAAAASAFCAVSFAALLDLIIN